MSIVIATYWLTVFHLARRDAGTITPTPTATARRPVTASSRPMMTTTIQASILSICSSETSAAATSNLSAIGSSNVPSVVTWLRRRAITPSSQSVSEARMKMPAAITAWTRDDEIRKTMRRGTATIRVIVRPMGKFTRAPYTRSALESLSGADDHLVNVRPVHRHHRRRVQHQAGGDVAAPSPRRQVAGPGRILAQPAHVLAVAAAELQRFARGPTQPGGRLFALEAIDQQSGAGVVLERDRPSLAGAHQRHVAPLAHGPRRRRAQVHEAGDADGGRAARGQERLGPVAGRHDQRLAPHPLGREVEGRVAQIEAGERLSATLAGDDYGPARQSGGPLVSLVGAGDGDDAVAAVDERGDDAGARPKDVDDEDGDPGQRHRPRRFGRQGDVDAHPVSSGDRAGRGS